MYISEKKAGYLLKHHCWDDALLAPIKDTLCLYMHNVLPKYISSFANTRIDGDFIIGISDDGEITGIPFKGHLSETFVNNLVQSSLQKMIRRSNNGDDITKQLVEVEVIQLETNEDVAYTEEEDVDHLFNEYKKTYMKNNNILMKYNEERTQWLSELGIYSNKLHIMINSRVMRDEILKYIGTVPSCDSVRTQLQGDAYISIPTFDILQTRKIDPSDVLYWLVEFRDSKKKEICRRRPTKPKLCRSYTPIQIVSKLSCMRPIFRKIEGVHYYMIIVHIYGSRMTGPVYYTDVSGGMWRKKYRKLHSDGSPYSE